MKKKFTILEAFGMLLVFERFFKDGFKLGFPLEDQDEEIEAAWQRYKTRRKEQIEKVLGFELEKIET